MRQRHWMMTPTRDAWNRLMYQRPELAGEPLVATWAEWGFPLVLRRPLPGDAPGEWPLGLPLPPSQGKRRIALTLAEQDILRMAPPLGLADAVATAPDEWQQTIRSLLGLDAATRCFGSLAWQHMTGLAYLSPTSDLDLLWDLPADPRRLLAGIDAIARTAPMRIDGEVMGAHGAVQWRELRDSVDSIVVKDEAAVALMPKDAFLAGACP
ncbi:malonate decarboxylase holo-[acyl-carrier-protein] synthase [Acidisoma cellulosilytica]|uniref:Malonate decarboxylase holo-[acyl-carrier-protein] synthase n=1 Tax=Acidisoma cellulosilyticum TaxID=2802395 RepID=A0A964E4G1_9PROT|nr:malonate decarboxylase holo-[acyl-carrier-protein] synthase [Acidisoma cellulosilyticum]MCB8881431.1 malonate decarboxylase holo-[acyl-carrier-protein] synthase [Acidisoma cellulosilyticum]